MTKTSFHKPNKTLVKIVVIIRLASMYDSLGKKSKAKHNKKKRKRLKKRTMSLRKLKKNW